MAIKLCLAWPPHSNLPQPPESTDLFLSLQSDKKPTSTSKTQHSFFLPEGSAPKALYKLTLTSQWLAHELSPPLTHKEQLKFHKDVVALVHILPLSLAGPEQAVSMYGMKGCVWGFVWLLSPQIAAGSNLTTAMQQETWPASPATGSEEEGVSKRFLKDIISKYAFSLLLVIFSPP